MSLTRTSIVLREDIKNKKKKTPYQFEGIKRR